MTTSPIKLMPEVQGKTLYLEFKPTLDDEGRARVWQGVDARLQIVVTPTGVDAAGNWVKPLIFNRIISSAYPRSQWSNNYVYPMASEETILATIDSTTRYNRMAGLKDEQLGEMSDLEKRNAYATGLKLALKNMTTRTRSRHNSETNEYEEFVEKDWEFVRKFAVETTDEDLNSIKDWKIPAAVTRRIKKVLDTL